MILKLFKKKLSVDGILDDFTQKVQQLANIRAIRAQAVQLNNERIKSLTEDNALHELESERALRVQGKLEEILK